MKKLLRDIRLLPVVIAAAIALVVLKTAGLVIEGGYLFTASAEAPRASAEAPTRQSSQQSSWAQQMLNFPGGQKIEPDPDVTGSVASAPKPDAPATKPAEVKPLEGVPVFPDPREHVSASERAVLERLQARRQELDTRARELEIRENLIKAAEKRLEAKADELKAIEQRADEAKERKSEADAARLKGVVTMYEGMKPKDAARIFDRLEMTVLFEIASQIKPQKMADIIAQMSAEAAERLTVELSRQGAKPAPAAELPKIEGRPR
jgi:flagellar motility protein MotE (MotC chaperone)